MTGIAAFNFPAFDAAAAELRARGIDVVSPSELDNPQQRAAALASPDGAPGPYVDRTGTTHGDLLARDVKLIADGVDGIAVLPGWHRSRGVRLETFVAFLYGKPTVYASTLRRVPFSRLVATWLGGGDS